MIATLLVGLAAIAAFVVPAALLLFSRLPRTRFDIRDLRSLPHERRSERAPRNDRFAHS